MTRATSVIIFYQSHQILLTDCCYYTQVSYTDSWEPLVYHNYQVLFVGKPTKHWYRGILGNINDVTKHGSMVSIFIYYYLKKYCLFLWKCLSGLSYQCYVVLKSSNDYFSAYRHILWHSGKNCFLKLG